MDSTGEVKNAMSGVLAFIKQLLVLYVCHVSVFFERTAETQR